MAFGSFVFMLHSHLPYYRKHGMWPFGEENLYECMAETYMPLLNALFELKAEGIQANLTVGITPILAEQLADKHSWQGFINYLNQRLTAAKLDVERYPDPDVEHSQHLAYLANWYVKHFEKLLYDFEVVYKCDLIAAFKQLQDEGCIEITTSSATHGFSPLLATDDALQAQFKTGVESYKKLFGRQPKGTWLPECAYRPAKVETLPNGETKLRPSIDAFLFENGLEYFFTEYHAIEGGASTGARRVFGVYGNIEYIPLPARPKTGLNTYQAYWMKDYPVAVMGRNDRASFQVWSAAHGYPGDGLYREFHRKDANSGLHYWRLTSKEADLGEKMLYDPVLAHEQTEVNASHFVNLVYHQAKDYNEATGEHALLLVSFDTELYGHWWFEGVTWLKHVIKKMHAVDGVDMVTASTYLEKHPPESAIDLPESTWGQGGHYWVWQNQDTDWMWPIIHSAEYRMGELVGRYQDETDPLKVRVLNQTLRELLLLQSSDWPFLVTTFQAKDNAIERFNEHTDRFWTLSSMLETQHVDEATLALFEDEDNPFENVDYRWYTYTYQADRQALIV